jgi:hypothetical protein
MILIKIKLLKVVLNIHKPKPSIHDKKCNRILVVYTCSPLGEEQRHMNMKVHIIAKANSQGNIKKEIYTRTK